MFRYLKWWVILFACIGIGSLMLVDRPGEDLLRGSFITSSGLLFFGWLYSRLR